MLRNTITIICITLFTQLVLAQANNDKRGFKGEVKAQVKKTIRIEVTNTSTNEDEIETTIIFDGRSIKIGNETYEIVKRTFDGEKSTTFTCTKRRSTFEVTFVAGESIKIIDKGNEGHEVHYLNISE